MKPSETSTDGNELQPRERLLQAIEHDSEDVRVALHDLTDAAGNKLDPGERIRTSPLAWTLGAFLVGTWPGSRETTAGIAPQRRQS